jgi:hypothetical protein
MAKARQVAEFGHDAHRVNELNAATGLQHLHQGPPAPAD